MNYPKISIITPSYNQDQFLEETIQSVLSQNYPNIEYIIIDGGSTDNSVDIIKKYEKSLAFWVSEKDNGQTYAINKGLKMCSGDIIAYINSDDIYMVGAFEYIAKFFNENPKYDMVYGDCYIINENSKVIRKKLELDFDYLMGCFIGFGIIIPQPTVFFARAVFEKIGFFNEKYNYAMDAEYWARIATVSKIEHISKYLASFRVHTASKTKIHLQETNNRYSEESIQLIRKSYENLMISNIISFRYSFIIRKIYRIKRILVKFIKGFYFD